VSVKIKLKRMGKIRNPQYRIIVADARTKRDGRAIEEIGKYHPKEDPSFIEVQSERAQYWLGVGAQPTEAVAAILKVTGDWQKFKGLEAPAPMKVAAPKADRKAVFEAAAKEAADEPKAGATTPKKKAEKAEKADKAEKTEPKAGGAGRPDVEVKAEDAPVETPVETPAPEVASEIATEA
jgi:small subunit ribosomal protein S16